MSKHSTQFLVFASATDLMVSLVSCSTLDQVNNLNNQTTATKTSSQASPSTLALTHEVMLNGSDTLLQSKAGNFVAPSEQS
jgi:hypothetical protein